MNTVATDALVLKHQAISIHSADQVSIVLAQLHTKMLYLEWPTQQIKILFKKITHLFKV